VYPLTAGIVVQTKELWDESHAVLKDSAVRVMFELAEISDWPSFEERIRRTTPELILLDLASIRIPIEEAVARIRVGEHPPAVFALHTNAAPDSILAALRAGAAEYLFPPLADTLRNGLARLAAQRDKQRESFRKGGRTIGFLSAKGGCGATTLACHIAVELAAAAKTKVLLADLDLESGLVGFLMKSESGYSVSDALVNLQRLDASYWRALVSNGHPGVEIISAPSSPRAKQVDAAQFRHVLNFIKQQYDWSVVDLGRNLNAYSLNTLEAIDEAFIVSTLEVAALHQAKHLIRLLIDSGYSAERMRLVLNRMPKKSEITIEELEKLLGLSVFATIPNEYEPLQEAVSEGKLVSSTTNIGKNFARIARKIAGIEHEPRRKFSFFG
jgi:pilus assembly protein CpaE